MKVFSEKIIFYVCQLPDTKRYLNKICFDISCYLLFFN
jgi:hypothetical protein